MTTGSEVPARLGADPLELAVELALTEDEAGYVAAARAPNTLRGYRSDWAEFTAWWHRVFEAGPHQLWQAVEQAHQLWQTTGQPGWERFGLTITDDHRHEFWLDTPHSPEHAWAPTCSRRRTMSTPQDTRARGTT